MTRHAAIMALATFCCHGLGAQALTPPVFPPPAAIPSCDTVRMVVIGDVMMHSRQLEYDSSTFLEGLSPMLENADFAVANAEFSLGGKPYSGYPSFSAPDSYAVTLQKDCGIDVLLTANNHILDRGSDGLVRTLSVYDSLGIRHTGTARDEKESMQNNPLMLTRKGIRIALVNFTYGTNHPGPRSAYPKVCGMDREELSSCIEKARRQGADFIIALPHWGTEYMLEHDRSQEELAEWLAGQGVDAIVGSHPHVVQDSCTIGAVPVYYSLGNAVSNMSAKNTRLGLAVEFILVKDAATGSRECFSNLYFTWCTLPGTLTGGYRTILIKEWAGRRNDWLTPSDYDNMLRTLERVSTSTGISAD